ncbi:MAG: hypothetical protein V4724_25445 [Pseudomonadota bacterium]
MQAKKSPEKEPKPSGMILITMATIQMKLPAKEFTEHKISRKQRERTIDIKGTDKQVHHHLLFQLTAHKKHL